MSLWDTVWAARAGNVFTTHTRIAAALLDPKPTTLESCIKRLWLQRPR
jgi:hypothetical protein